MGQCLLNGFTWNNYAISGGSDSTTFTSSTGSPTVAVSVVAGNWNCLRCHNSTSQNNSYAGRWKESYLQQGHKNHLRKVSPGKPWSTPNGSTIVSSASPTGTITI